MFPKSTGRLLGRLQTREFGLHEMVWGLGGRNAAQVDGVQGRVKSPCEWLGGDTLTWDGSWEGARRPFPTARSNGGRLAGV